MAHLTDDLEDWPFAELPETGVYTTKSIIEGNEPIMRVFHDPEGDWQFHGSGESSVGSGALACFHCIVLRDPTLRELADLPISWAAWRDLVGGPWQREEYRRSEE